MKMIMVAFWFYQTPEKHVSVRLQHRNSSSVTRDRRTDDNVKIKFMVSLQWFPLAVALGFDLEAAAAKHASPPSLSLLMAEAVCKSQDIPAVGW